MTQPMPPIALSLWAQTPAQPLPLSPTPASVPRLQLQRTSVGRRLPAPQPPCPPWNADQKTRHNRSAPDWRVWILSPSPSNLEQMLGMAVTPGSLPAYSPTGPAQRGHSFLSFIHPIFPALGIQQRARETRHASSSSLQSSRSTDPNKQIHKIIYKEGASGSRE